MCHKLAPFPGAAHGAAGTHAHIHTRPHCPHSHTFTFVPLSLTIHHVEYLNHLSLLLLAEFNLDALCAEFRNLGVASSFTKFRILGVAASFTEFRIWGIAASFKAGIERSAHAFVERPHLAQTRDQQLNPRAGLHL
eukprot:365201-Chlamydomonas_euryale.AAC.3